MFSVGTILLEKIPFELNSFKFQVKYFLNEYFISLTTLCIVIRKTCFAYCSAKQRNMYTFFSKSKMINDAFAP